MLPLRLCYRRGPNAWTIYKDVGRMKGIRQGNGAAPPELTVERHQRSQLEKTRRGNDCKSPASAVAEEGVAGAFLQETTNHTTTRPSPTGKELEQ